MHVLSVTAAGTQPVWNLAVDDHHEFYAEGILVSNCDALRYAVHSSRSLWRGAIPVTAADAVAPGSDEILAV